MNEGLPPAGSSVAVGRTGSQTHRLILAADEVALLVERSAFALPPGFGAPTPTDAAGLAAARTRLLRRRVIVGSGSDTDAIELVKPVAANVAVLAAPAVAVRFDVAVRGLGLRAVFGVAQGLGAGLITLADGALELSMFPAAGLGRELVRAVPELRTLRSTTAGFAAALGGSPEPHGLTGYLPLAGLGSFDELRQVTGGNDPGLAAAALGLTRPEAALADAVFKRSAGTLVAQVSGRVAGEPAVAQVVWLATDEGWTGIRPAPDGTSRQLVELLPVDPQEIGVWLAPYIGLILEAASV